MRALFFIIFHTLACCGEQAVQPADNALSAEQNQESTVPSSEQRQPQAPTNDDTSVDQTDEEVAESDRALIESIQNAVRNGADIRSIRTYVSAEAVIDTRDSRDRLALRFGDFQRDPDRPDEGLDPNDWLKADDLMYWVLAIQSRNPKIVGIAWFANAPPEIFFAEVLPP